MPDISTNLEDFTVWVAGNRLPSLVSIKMPKLTKPKVEFKGAGVMGAINYGAKCRLESIQVGLKFQTFRQECLTLFTDAVVLDCRAGVQLKAGNGSGMYIVPEQVILGCEAQELDLGEWMSGDKNEVSTDLEVTSIQAVWNGTTVINIDKERYIWEINGVDMAADIRAALGL